MTYPKRLIEVDLPIKKISAHARREKSIRHGHISTLHIWWARRPLAACRAVICAALWPDPADEQCPQSFRDAAANILTEFAEQVRRDAKLAELVQNHWQRWNRTNEATFQNLTHAIAYADMRHALLDFIADFANWDASTVPAFLDAARALTQAAHKSLGGLPDTRPLVVDPFAGGGAIPLEALRVGADSFASDLNPIAVLINRMEQEYIPKHGQRLVDAVRKWGDWIREEAEKELAKFYPKDPDGARPIAYLWARTIRCEGPRCGAEVPLIKSLWLGKKPHNSWSLRLHPNFKAKKVEFEVVRGAKPKDVGVGTVQRGSATCPCCGYTTPVQSVRQQLALRSGGTADATLFCVVTLRSDERGRFYRVPTQRDLDTFNKAVAELDRRVIESKEELPLVPDEELPPQGTLGFRVQLYGIKKWGDLFNPRQALALLTLYEKVRMVREQIDAEHPDGIGEAVQVALAFNVDKMADYGSSLASWSSPASQETVRGTFSRQALPIVWDYAEAYPFVDSSGGWSHNLNFLISPLDAEAQTFSYSGNVTRTSATNHPLPDESADAFITDPPYYDAIPYSDLSDFFIVWLNRSLAASSLASDIPRLSPKDQECVVDEIKGHDREFFETTMTKALTEGRRLTKLDGIGIIVFAHKSTAGWETQLLSLVNAGWIITGSWPIDTERSGRVRANDSAALASSIHLVCRPRNAVKGSFAIGDWRDVLQELPQRIHAWLPRLAQEGVVGADAIFACLGPALEIFSRYSRVEKASGEQVTLKEYLEYVWAAVSKEALGMVFAGADATGFEEDARLTAMWLWTLRTDVDQPNGNGKEMIASTGYTLEYDAARKIAQGLGAHLEKLDHLVEIKGSNARLLPVSARMRHLFGKEGIEASTRPAKKQSNQLSLFDTGEAGEAATAEWGDLTASGYGETVLDRVHQSMLLFAAGRSEALRRFLVEEGVGQDSRYWSLANALSALYPPNTDEKRWVDGVLARKKGLGF